MRAVICTLNSQYIHSSLAPYCLLAGVKKYGKSGIFTTVIEGTVNERIDDVLSRIIADKPNVVGLCCYIWNIKSVKNLIRLIKAELPNCIIVLGGPEVSYCAKKVLKENPCVDYILSGEGEKTFAYLLNAIFDKADIQGIPGLCYTDNNIIVVSDPNIETDTPITPYSSEYFQALNGRIAYLETSRGCPYSCAFCLSGRCGGVRFFDIEKSKSDIIALANSGTQTIKLIDRTFNADKKRAYEIFEFIISNYGDKIPHGICFHFEIAADILDERTIILLNTAPKGAVQLEIGLQSFNEKTLNYINRKTDIHKLQQNIQKLLYPQNIHIHIDLIAGLPFEDYESFKTGFNLAYSLKPNMLQFGFLKLLFGSPMRENPERYACKYSENPPYEICSTPYLSEEELKTLHLAENALDRLYNSGRFRRTLEYLAVTYTSPFDLFHAFGAYAKNHEHKSLDEYTKLVYDFFNDNNPNFRDAMAVDRLTTNASGTLPGCLKIPDTALKKLKNMYPPKKGIKRGYAILYGENKLFYIDYENRDPVTGEWRGNYVKNPFI